MNGIDLQTVTNTTPNGSKPYNDLLLTLSNYNGQHEPQQVAAANGQVTTLTYNAAGQLTSSTDPLGNTWTYYYPPQSAVGYLRSIVGPAAPQVPTYSFTYDGYGRLYTSTGPDGVKLTYSYDAADRLTTTLFPDQTTEVRGYEVQGHALLDLTSFTDRRGYQTSFQYDADRELIEIDEPAGRVTKIPLYWANGKVQTVLDPLGFPTNFARDVQGRIQTITYPDNTQKWFTYDNAGRITLTAPTNSPNGPGQVRYSYNGDDTVSEIDYGSGLPTFFQYDPAYRRLKCWIQAPPMPCGGSAEPVANSEAFSYYPVTSPPTLGANRLFKDVTTLTDITHPASAPSVSWAMTTRAGFQPRIWWHGKRK